MNRGNILRYATELPANCDLARENLSPFCSLFQQTIRKSHRFIYESYPTYVSRIQLYSAQSYSAYTLIGHQRRTSVNSAIFFVGYSNDKSTDYSGQRMIVTAHCEGAQIALKYSQQATQH